MADINHKLERQKNREYQNSLRYKKDIEDGNKAEKDCHLRLETKFGELKKTDRYCYFDYENDKYIIELKSRNINHDAYPTAMINLPKIEKWMKHDRNRKFIIAFQYKDGLYYWDYDCDEVESKGTTGRNDRGCIETYEMVYFKHELLTFIPHPKSPIL